MQPHTTSHEEAVASPSSSRQSEPEGGRTRRAALKALGVAAAGAVAGGLVSPKEAAADHGEFNVTSNDLDPAIHGNNTNDGPGVEATSFGGPGLRAKSVFGTGVVANGGLEGGIGVHGIAYTGVFGEATHSAGTGVRGRSGFLVGVWGQSGYGPAVLGEGEGIGVSGVGGDIGVEGASDRDIGVGVLARNPSGAALKVAGVAQFSTAGNGSIPAFQDSAFVGHSAITGASHVTVTLTGSPGAAVGPPPTVMWVERQPGVGFVVHLTRKVGVVTPFSYLIVEPGT